MKNTEPQKDCQSVKREEKTQNVSEKKKTVKKLVKKKKIQNSWKIFSTRTRRKFLDGPTIIRQKK